jgi:hypothetical protein
MSFQGKKNVYTCTQGHKTITVDLHEGVTPFMMICKADGCKETAQSCMYRCPQDLDPEYEWFRPTADEAKQIIEQAVAKIPKDIDHYQDRVEGLTYSFNYHFDNGGLHLRKIIQRAS